MRAVRQPAPRVLMTPEDAIRFLAHEAQRCRDRDSHEMHVLLYPAMLRVLDLPPMDAVEAAAFHCEFHESLRERQRVMTGADFPN